MFRKLTRPLLIVILGIGVFINTANSAPYSVTYGETTYNFTGNEWFVSPSGTSTTTDGTGSDATPWDIQTAFSGASGKIKAGDIVWLKAGQYLPSASTLNISVSGTPLSPVVFRNYQGGRVTIDGRDLNGTLINLNGSYVWLWGVEITDSNPATPVYSIGSAPYGLMSGANIANQAKLINVVAHDNYNGGMGLYKELVDLEVYGSLSFNNGRANSPNNGYGVYSQNLSADGDTRYVGEKIFEDNVFLNNFGNYPIHVYTEGGKIDNFRFRNNVAFGGGKDGRWILIGGTPIAQNPIFSLNIVYGVGFDLGFQTYGGGANNCIITDNVFIGNGDDNDREVFLNPKNTNSTVTRNRFINKATSFSRSTYPSNSYVDVRPTGTELIIRPNKYERGRGIVTVLNWGRANAANLDLAQLKFNSGESFRIVDAQNYYGIPLLTGTYTGGAITLPLTSTAVQQAVAMPPGFSPWAHTDKEFNVFIVERTTSVGAVAPAAPLNLRFN